MSCGSRQIKVGGGQVEAASCRYELVERLKNTTVEVLRCPRCGDVSIGWYMQPNTEDITNERKETTTQMAEQFPLKEWAETELWHVTSAAQNCRQNPGGYRDYVESIHLLQLIRMGEEPIVETGEGPVLVSKIAEPAAPPEVKEESEPPLEKSDVRAKLVEMKNNGLELKALWDAFGVTGLSGIDPKDYRKLLAKAEELLE